MRLADLYLGGPSTRKHTIKVQLLGGQAPNFRLRLFRVKDDSHVAVISGDPNAGGNPPKPATILSQGAFAGVIVGAILVG